MIFLDVRRFNTVINIKMATNNFFPVVKKICVPKCYVLNTYTGKQNVLAILCLNWSCDNLLQLEAIKVLVCFKMHLGLLCMNLTAT